ncbi:hypothetical protein [Methylocystis heyeri]|uniref:Uncharacterized protein n=1 Tax=Methylocystis heyeri TaxID=391905 RepID=A0A6B8KF96_9HYPH|nr:hypothetical protein [Methylocystis heyeri]QGM45080.1 hypothetical protein H2LOC_004900 [Methylocystis heyeri]
MVKIIRLLGLVSQSIFLQFVHLVGLVAFLIAAALGYFKVPSWVVPIVAVVSGVAVDKFADVTDVTGLLEKASKANERGGFLILVYAVITVVGYIVGAYGRHHHDRLKATTSAPKLNSK